MTRRFLIVLGFLVLLRLAWPLLGTRVAGIDGWMVAAYAVVLCSLVAYRSALGSRSAGPGEAVRCLLDVLGLLALLFGLYLALFWAPQEKTMGMVQRIFYIHVPSAWVAFLAFGLVLAGSLGWLIKRSLAADRLAAASAEIGVMFTTLVLITGPIWAKPVWGIWWTWDARLTLTLVLWLVYMGYLLLRAWVPDPGQRRTLAAATGILGFIGVPIDYMAIRWWRTQHPQPVIAGGEGSGLDPAIRTAFFVMLGAFTLIYVALLLRRVAIARQEEG